MRGLGYILVEGLTGLNRAKFSSFLTVVTVAISLFMWGLFFAGSQSLMEIGREIKKRVRFEAFIDNSFEEREIQTLRAQILALPGIDSVHYVSKSEAIKVYRELFGDDYLDIIEENPLPASFQIFLTPDYLNDDSAAVLIQQLQRFSGIDDIVYRERLLNMLSKYLTTLRWVVIGMGIGLGALSFILISTNIKLTMMAKQRIIETMELVGATPPMIWGPFVVQGCFEGLLGGLFAGAAIWLVKQVVVLILGIPLQVSMELLTALVAFGMLFGLTGSWFSIYRNV